MAAALRQIRPDGLAYWPRLPWVNASRRGLAGDSQAVCSNIMQVWRDAQNGNMPIHEAGSRLEYTSTTMGHLMG